MLEYCMSVLLPFLFLLGIFSMYVRWTETYWQRKGLSVLDGCDYEDGFNLRDNLVAIYNAAKEKKYRHVGIYTTFWNIPIYVPIDLKLIKFIIEENSGHFLDSNTTNISKNATEDVFVNLRKDLELVMCSDLTNVLWDNSIQSVSEMNMDIEEVLFLTDAIDIREILLQFSINILSRNVLGLRRPGNQIRKYVEKFVLSNQKSSSNDFIPPGLLSYMQKWRIFSNEQDEADKSLIYLLQDNDEKIRDINIPNLPQILIGIKPNEEQASRVLIYTLCLGLFKLYVPFLMNTLMVAINELSYRPREQEMIRREMAPVNNSLPTYQGLRKMNNIKNVLNETLRLYPPASSMDRICQKHYEVPDTLFVIEPGTVMTVPISGINHDQDFYPDPETFKLDRDYEDLNIFKGISPVLLASKAYLGSQFVVDQAEVALSSIISNYVITTNDNTQVNPKSAIDHNSLLNNQIKFIKVNNHK